MKNVLLTVKYMVEWDLYFTKDTLEKIKKRWA